MLVVEAERSCHVLVTPRRLHIAGVQTNAGGIHCGTKNSPWLLEAPAGQRINLGLLDFTQTTQNVSTSMSAASLPIAFAAAKDASKTNGVDCTHQRKPQVGYIIDKSVAGTAGTKIVSVCAGGGGTKVTGHYHLYLSRSNVVELVLASVEELVNDGPKVLISFEGKIFMARLKAIEVSLFTLMSIPILSCIQFIPISMIMLSTIFNLSEELLVLRSISIGYHRILRAQSRGGGNIKHRCMRGSK